MTRPYALVVILAVALITVASDAGAITDSHGRRSGLVAVLGDGSRPPSPTKSDQPAPTGITPGSQAAVTPAGSDPNATPAPERPGVPVVSVAPTPGVKPCFKSFDPACPPQRWDPQPKNQPLSVSFRFVPQHPLPGQLVRFTIVLDDPDTSQNLMIDGAYFGDDPAAAATPGALGAASAQGTNDAPGCPTPRGTWPPPAPGPHGHTTVQLTYTYQAVGAYQVHFLASSGQRYDPCHLGDPYASKASSATQTVNVDQPPPPPTIPPTVPPTNPPPGTTTTTPGSGAF